VRSQPKVDDEWCTVAAFSESVVVVAFLFVFILSRILGGTYDRLHLVNIYVCVCFDFPGLDAYMRLFL
jgi:hypothetical protein